ncbi:MAG: DMT family transporter, partial [Firmicutes bacterium]|nr:DMT family transporter [Bacillota bacterium]
MDSSKRSAGHIMALVCILFWGSAFIASKVIVNGEFRPAQIIFCRLLLVFIILSLATREYVPLGGWKGIRRDRYLILAGFLGTAVYYLLESTALQFTYATNVSLIVTISPLFSTVFDRFLPRED